MNTDHGSTAMACEGSIAAANECVMYETDDEARAYSPLDPTNEARAYSEDLGLQQRIYTLCVDDLNGALRRDPSFENLTQSRAKLDELRSQLRALDKALAYSLEDFANPAGGDCDDDIPF